MRKARAGEEVEVKAMDANMAKIKDGKNANSNLNLGPIEISLRTRIKLYKKRAQEIERYLSKKPDEWGKFQNEFNEAVDAIFRDIMEFEKINLANGNKEKVDKLKRLFINRIRKLFMRKEYSEWSIRKPLGYAGDYKIIDDIYQNNPSTNGFDRLFDNYYQMSAICVGVRNRKEDFKRLIINFTNSRKGCEVRIMNLGSGACREVKEILSSDILLNKNIIFDCYDKDERAIEFARNLLAGFKNVNFIKENALRIAAARDINSKIKERYDLIYVTGLFDYLSNRVCIRLIKNLKKILNLNGILAVSNMRDKYSNPSVHYMEWAGDWNLVYRSDDEFTGLFIEGGFKNNQLKKQYEQQGIMQYIIASNSK